MGLQHFCQHLPVKSWIVRDGEELGILHADLRIASAMQEAGQRAWLQAEHCSPATCRPGVGQRGALVGWELLPEPSVLIVQTDVPPQNV